MPFFEITFTGCSLVDDMKAKEFPLDVVTNSYLFIRLLILYRIYIELLVKQSYFQRQFILN
jgi:hypothetical protein